MKTFDIGNTPLVTVPELAPYPIYRKDEFRNPSGSHYDRAYFPTVQYLEEKGLLTPGSELRDISSGSAAISLAMIGTDRGYKVRITAPEELSDARLAAMREYGANVVSSGSGYIQGASKFQAAETKAMARDRDWERLRAPDSGMRAVIFKHKMTNERICYVNHSENQLSPDSFRAIGHELVADMVETPVAIALAMGNWTTIAGISPVVKAAWPDIKILGYESPAGEVYENYGMTNHDSDGTDVPLRFRDDSLLDAQYQITTDERDVMDERINAQRTLEEKIGRSSLMGLVVAEQAARELGGPVITIAYDTMSRY